VFGTKESVGALIILNVHCQDHEAQENLTSNCSKISIVTYYHFHYMWTLFVLKH